MFTVELTFSINGKSYEMEVDVRKSLMELLREIGYTSVKHGCGVGECGACTVLVNDVPVDSCLYLATWVNGAAVRTTEGECRDGKLSPVQDAYVQEGAVQCGFCTPGLIMNTTAFLEKNRGKEELSREEIKKGHAGNLCRCTGYQTIINAVEAARKKDVC